jgi:hypothetical protein
MLIKIFLVFSILLTLSLNTNAQTCTSLHEGKFRLSEKELGITVITRNEKYQTEVNPNFNIVFSINWVDECTYELRPVKVIKADVSILEKDIVVTVKIIDIKKHGYKVICSTNFSKEKTTYILEILD